MVSSAPTPTLPLSERGALAFVPTDRATRAAGGPAFKQPELVFPKDALDNPALTCLVGTKNVVQDKVFAMDACDEFMDLYLNNALQTPTGSVLPLEKPTEDDAVVTAVRNELEKLTTLKEVLHDVTFTDPYPDRSSNPSRTHHYALGCAMEIQGMATDYTYQVLHQYAQFHASTHITAAGSLGYALGQSHARAAASSCSQCDEFRTEIATLHRELRHSCLETAKLERTLCDNQ